MNKISLSATKYVSSERNPFWGYALIGNSVRGLFERDDYVTTPGVMLATQILLIDNPSNFLTELLDIMQIWVNPTVPTQPYSIMAVKSRRLSHEYRKLFFFMRSVVTGSCKNGL